MATVVEGSLEVTDLEGRVVVTFRQKGKEPAYAAFDPGAAMELADNILKASYQAEYGKPRPVLVTMADMVIERKRKKLNNRGLVMLRSMREQAKSDQHIVSNLVDACLKEAT